MDEWIEFDIQLDTLYAILGMSLSRQSLALSG